MRYLRPNSELQDEMSSRKNLDLANRLHNELEQQVQRSQLSLETGIKGKRTLDNLLSHGIKAETLPALQLSPLFFVAWADGELDHKEQQTILEFVQSWGITPSDPSYHFISYWLEVPPSPEYFDVWRVYVSGGIHQADLDSFLQMKFDILHQVKMVAEASGGYWGFGNSISLLERKEIQKLEEAFAA